MNNEDYIVWILKILEYCDKLLKDNGVVLMNLSYGTENPNVFWKLISRIITDTPYMVADTIIWKKLNALPNNVSSNKLTRICEHIFVICRKEEYKTFQCNKQIKSVSKTGQNYYENIFNFVEAKNNDGANKLNKATYSSELCEKLLNLYCKENDTILDMFNGTGLRELLVKD